MVVLLGTVLVLTASRSQWIDDSAGRGSELGVHADLATEDVTAVASLWESVSGAVACCSTQFIASSMALL